MIAFLCEETLPIEPFGTLLRHKRQTVWGPFHAITGKDPNGDEPRIVARVNGRTGFHAAARLAAQNGARLVIGIGFGHASPATWQEIGARPAIIPISEVADFTPLADLQAITADLTPPGDLSDPPPPAAIIPFTPGGHGIRAATTPFSLTIPALARFLNTRDRIGVFDTNALGLAEALGETSLHGAMYLLARAPVTPAANQPENNATRHQILYRDIIQQFLEESGW